MRGVQWDDAHRAASIGGTPLNQHARIVGREGERTGVAKIGQRKRIPVLRSHVVHAPAWQRLIGAPLNLAREVAAGAGHTEIGTDHRRRSQRFPRRIRAASRPPLDQSVDQIGSVQCFAPPLRLDFGLVVTMQTARRPCLGQNRDHGQSDKREQHTKS